MPDDHAHTSEYCDHVCDVCPDCGLSEEQRQVRTQEAIDRSLQHDTERDTWRTFYEDQRTALKQAMKLLVEQRDEIERLAGELDHWRGRAVFAEQIMHFNQPQR